MEIKLALIAAVVVLGLGFFITGCTYRINVVVPLKMAEKGFCWRPVVVPGATPVHTYAPCPKE